MGTNDYEYWGDFQVYLGRYFVDDLTAAKTRIDEMLLRGTTTQMRRKARTFNLCEHVKPAVDELEPHIKPIHTHDFFVNFWRIELDRWVGKNLNELPLHAIAVKHEVKIELVAPFRNDKRQRCLKVYPSTRPRFANKV